MTKLVIEIDIDLLGERSPAAIAGVLLQFAGGMSDYPRDDISTPMPNGPFNALMQPDGTDEIAGMAYLSEAPLNLTVIPETTMAIHQQRLAMRKAAEHADE